MTKPTSLYLVCAALALPADTSALQALHYEGSQVADGVWLFEPNDQGVGNVTAIVSGTEALVVDASATPAAAEQIRDWLRDVGVVKVSALINTHWHDDHVWGNQVFVDAFPGVRLLAHPFTVNGIRDMAVAALAEQIQRLHQRIAERDTQLRGGVTADGTPLDAGARARLEQRQALFRDAVASLETVRPVLPSPLSSETLEFTVGDIPVVVEHLGEGHTEGDLVVRVPTRAVVIVGDLVTLPIPAAAEGNLIHWSQTLEALLESEWTTLVPGHGSAMEGNAYPEALVDLFSAVIAYVREGVDAGQDVETLIEDADLGTAYSPWASEDPRQSAMFKAFFLEPSMRTLYSALTGG